MGFLQASLAGLTIFGTHSCNEVLSNNVVHIGTKQEVHHVRLMEIAPERVNARKFEVRRAVEKDYSRGIQSFVSSASAKDMGMNGVPVLDQGEFGTCVTFSSTAAIDAIVAQGDFISQQCSLALDASLGNDWWDGAYYPSQIIQPLQQYGVVQKYSCPSLYPDRYQVIDPQQYSQIADPDASLAVKEVKYDYYAQPSLEVVKSSLRAGKRVLLAFLLDASAQEAIQGFNVVKDGYARSGGLWACKQGRSPNHCIQSQAGHEVLIIGFDDKQELLKIRNSWGNFVGDEGDYYMTYTFFKQMGVDMTVVF